MATSLPTQTTASRMWKARSHLYASLPITARSVIGARPYALGLSEKLTSGRSGKLFERAQLAAQLVVPLLRRDPGLAGHCLVVPDVDDRAETLRLRARAGRFPACLSFPSCVVLLLHPSPSILGAYPHVPASSLFHLVVPGL